MQTYNENSLATGFKATLVKEIGALPEPELLNPLCEQLDVDKETVTHEFLGQSPQMTAFEGERKYGALVDRGYSITNQPYDAALLFSREDIKRNTTNSFTRRIQGLASVASNHPTKLIMDTIIAGTAGLCYDGDEFFDATHRALQSEGGTQSNLLTGTGVTVAQISADIAAAIAAMRNFTSENGEPAHQGKLSDLLFVVPAALETNFRTILGATAISSTTNIQIGIGDLYPSARLSDVNDWYLFNTGSPAGKPLIYQVEQGLETDFVGTNSQLWTEKRQMAFGVSTVVGAGYGMWQSAIKTTNT